MIFGYKLLLRKMVDQHISGEGVLLEGIGTIDTEGRIIGKT